MKDCSTRGRVARCAWPRPVIAAGWLVVAGLLPASGPAAELLAHWHLDESGPPYSDAGVYGLSLSQDPETVPALAGLGLEATSAYLNWVVGSNATRLVAAHALLQTDSFGFSLWINPVNLNPFDSLLTKEMTATGAGVLFTRIGWQLHLLDNNGSGAAALELIVRGDQRGQGDFFGAVQSGVALPLATNTPAWFHVAGGYDAITGALKLYVNGVETASGNSSPGAHHHDGGPLALGSARNGSSFVTYSAIAFMDDVQIYNGPVTAAEAAFLMAHPGEPLRSVWITGQSLGAGSSAVGFEARGGRAYEVGVATQLAAFVTAATVTSSIPLLHDAASASALHEAGLAGDGAQLRWVSPETSATRLFATDESLQTDSFGFSFWLKPDNINPDDSLLAKEMVALGAGPLYTRMAWQVHVLGDNGFGLAPLELVVRGDQRPADFFGSATSAAVVPLHVNSPNWIHVAGGYDASTGALRLYVDAVETVSGNSSAGADHSDGGALALGSVRNGPDFVAFAAAAHLDEVQLYDGALTAAAAAFLQAHPAAALPHLPRLVARWPLDDAGAPYADVADGVRTAWATVAQATLDAVLGAGPRSVLFFRILEAPSAPGY